MLQTFKNGQGSIVLRFKLLDSSSTTGAGLTGLTSASSGLIISTIADNEATATAYTQAGSTIESITTLGTFAAPTATKCRFKEVDATNHKGVYEFQIADARYAVSSAKSILISVSGATNLQQADVVVQLQSDDPYVAKPTNSNLLSVDSNGRVDVIKLAGTTQTARDIGASVLLSTGTGTGQLDFTAGVVKANTTQFAGQTVTAAAGVTLPSSVASPTNITAGTITTVTNLTNAPTAGDLTATMKTSVTTAATAATPIAASVTGAVGSVAGNVVGSVGSVVGAVGSVTGLTSSNLDVAVSTLATAANLATVAGYIDTEVAAILAAVDTEVAAIKAKTDNLPASPAAVGSAMTLSAAYDAAKTAAQAGDAMTLTSAYDFAKGTVAMTEGYAADGATATPSQMMYMLWSLMAEKNIAGTTMTAKKLDGSTTSMTFTLNDATSPTGITRAT